MKAVRIHGFGGPEVLSLDEVPVPQPEADELLVKVRATSVNPVDFKIRAGGYSGPHKEGFPIPLGRDLAGTVEACGSAAHRVKAGDPIYAMLGPDRGANAEYALVKEKEACAKPANVDFTVAAAVPLAALTAWQGLFEHGALQTGQRVLIHGGAGGVGHFAIQLAKAKGAFVATTVSGQDIDFARDLGADEVVDYKKTRFEDMVDDVDLVFDLIGGETQDRSWNVLKIGGAMISTLADPSQDKARAHGARGMRYMAKPHAGQLETIASLIDMGRVRPHIEAVYPLAEVAAAEARLENQHVRGKIVLRVAA